MTSDDISNLPVTVISEEIEIIGLALRTTAISFAPTIRSGWPSLSKSIFPYTVTFQNAKIRDGISKKWSHMTVSEKHGQAEF